MIIGNGLLAKTFAKYKEDEEIIIFASGVSNSLSIDKSNYEREKKLLLNVIQEYPTKKLIYFSSCDVANKQMNQKMYYQHKLVMEDIIENSCQDYSIFRLPQLISATKNDNTLINFLFNAIKYGKEFTIYSGTFKNLIDVRDVYKICSYIIDNNLSIRLINIINMQFIEVEELVLLFEKLLETKAKYKKINIASFPQYDDTITKKLYQKIGIVFTNNYLENTLKYYYKE